MIPRAARAPEGSDLFVHLAGTLAELGCNRLILERAGRPPTELLARVTDLPGTLREAIAIGPAVLYPPEAAWRLEFTADKCTVLGNAPDELRRCVRAAQ